MSVLRALVSTIVKMFAADLWLTIGAVAIIVLAAAALRANLAPPSALPFLIAAAIAAALAVGVVRGARPKA
jgi:hypothetical protein